MQKLCVKKVKFTREKGKGHLQITRGVASAVLHVFTVAVWKPQRLSIASFFFLFCLPLNVKLSAHTKSQG